MKKFSIRTILIAITILIMKAPAIGQTGALPREISNFYKTKNFLSTYSLKNEREIINASLLRKQDLSTLHNPRLRQIAYLLFSMSKEYYYPEFASLNRSGIPFELIMPSTYKIGNWYKNENHVTVYVNTYILGEMYNRVTVASYKPGRTPDDMDKFDYSKGSAYRYREIHEWSLENGRWVKESVNKVLIH